MNTFRARMKAACGRLASLPQLRHLSGDIEEEVTNKTEVRVQDGLLTVLVMQPFIKQHDLSPGKSLTIPSGFFVRFSSKGAYYTVASA